MQCLIVTGGVVDCFDTPEDILAAVDAGTYQAEGFDKGRIIWPLIPYSYNTINDLGGKAAPSAPMRSTGWAPMTPAATCWRG